MKKEPKQEVSGSIHHETFFEKISEKIHTFIDNIDTDFPLSGGDEPALHVH